MPWILVLEIRLDCYGRGEDQWEEDVFSIALYLKETFHVQVML